MTREESHLKKLGLLYGRYVGTHRGQAPKDEGEFRTFITSLGQDELAAMNISDAETLFISERDGEPYSIRYGEVQGAGIIAYEQVGVEGKRFIVNNLGAVEEVDEGRFQELVPPIHSALEVAP